MCLFVLIGLVWVGCDVLLTVLICFGLVLYFGVLVLGKASVFGFVVDLVFGCYVCVLWIGCVFYY